MEHAPYCGSRYGQNEKPKIAIMGYSHHGDLATDHPGMTSEVLDGVIAGNHPPTQFFHQIASYFGGEGDSFWNNVAFFNFGPRIVGGSEKKHDNLSEKDLYDAQARFFRILEKIQPDMLFVFTRKGWNSLPKTEEDQRGTSGQEIIAGEQFDRHHYRLFNDIVVQAFGLRHPERATKAVMAQAVNAALSMQADPPV